MGKNHRHNQQFRPQQPQSPKPQVQPQPQGVKTTVAESPTAPVVESIEDLVAQQTGTQVEPTPPPAPVAPAPEVKEETPAPAPAPQAEPPKQEAQPKEVKAVRIFKQPERRLTSEDVAPTVSPMFRRQMVNIHTPAGKKLVGLFDEYKKLMEMPTNSREANKARIVKLHQIVQTACPRGLTNAQVAQDLVRTTFDKLLEGWGTIYRDETLFRLDYTLPGGPADVDKLNMFIEAMIQLIEASTGESDGIAFMNDRLAKVVDSPAIMTAIETLREGVERRVKQRQKKF